MSVLGRLLTYTRDEQARVASASLCSVLNKLFDIAPEILIGMAVDVVVNRQDSLLARWGISSLQQQLAWLGVATFLIWFLESFFEYLYQIQWRNLAQRVQHKLRLDAYRHLQRLPSAQVEKRSTGSLLALLNDDVNQLERFLDGGANSLIQVLTSVILVGATFFYLSPLVAALAFLPIPAILFGAFFFQRRLQPRYAEVREQAARVNARLNTNLHGLINIQSYGSEDFEAARVEKESLKYQETNRRAIALSSAFTPVLRMAILAGFLCTLVVGGQQCLNGQLSAGSYSVLVFLTQRLLWPLTGLAATSDLYERAMASASRILDLLVLPAVDLEVGESINPSLIQGEIVCTNLSFAYPERGAVLTDLDLRLPAGQTTAVVGSTGSGKSTLVKLMLRFLESDQGQITIDGKNIRELSRKSLRRCFSLVSQDVFLSDDTVRHNIAYGSPDEDDDQRLLEAARVAEAESFVLSLPQGLDSRLGERAQQLSGGQRQRLAIARAVYRNAPILILDEATSAVDNETEAALARSLRKLCAGRTTLVIAHRLSSVRHADCIHVLDSGRIVESGTHEQLLSQDGLYTRLWAIQTGADL
ncbi:ABC transporter ATP-binding protein [bacterium]|nr:ABC transporter ATP-binding protein [bacterium]